MYPVWDKDTAPYISESKGVTNFVTFPQVLIRAFVLIFIGVLLFDVFKIYAFFMAVYNYIMMVFSML